MSEDFNLEEQLREHLLDAAEPTPPDLFAQIEAQIEGKERRKKRFFIWFWFGAGLAIIALGILLTAFGGNKPVNDLSAIREISNDSTDVVLIKPGSNNTSNQENGIAENEINNAKKDSTSPIKPQQIAQNRQNSNGFNQNAHQSDGNDQIEDNNESNLMAVAIPNANNLQIDSTETANSKIDPKVNDVENNGEDTANTAAQVKPVDNSNSLNGIEDLVYSDPNPNKTTGQTKIDSAETTNNIVDTDNAQNDSSWSAAIQNQSLLISNKVDTNDIVVTLLAKQGNTATETEIDTTIVPSNISNDQKDTTLIADKNIADSTSIPVEDLVIGQDSIPSIDSTDVPDLKTNTFGLLAYGGYMAFDQAVFKPYFSSGLLSQVDFPSIGSEYGLGAYYRFKNRFEFSLIGSYGQRNSNFNYDLMISESDFFNLYENDQEIPLENLDDPTSCNCFLAQGARLDYSIQTVAISLNASFDLIKKPKYSFGPLLGFGTVVNSKFSNNSSSIISFSPELKERFASSILRMGLSFHYQLTPKMQVGIAPNFNLQFTKKSSIYAKDSRLFLVPLQLKWAF